MSAIVIGNAHDLIWRRRGAEIDSFDNIVRINSFIIDGYEEFVGSRIDLVSVCFASALVNGALQYSADLIRRARLLWTPYAKGYHKEVSIDQGLKMFGKTHCDLMFADDLVSLDMVYRTFDELVMYKKRQASKAEAERFRPTTGLLTLIVAADVFSMEEIAVAGFGLEGDRSNRRFDTSGVEMWEYHDLEWERGFILEGVKQGRWRAL